MADHDAVFAWAARFSDLVHNTAALRDLERQIHEGRTTCGSCIKWMKRSCPRETHDNTTGRSRGPSCGAVKCGEFVMSPLSEELMRTHEAEADALRAKIKGAAHG